MIERVAVIGAGTMGHGIAAVSAMAGSQVALADSDPVACAAAMIRIGSTLDKAIERGKLAPGDRAAVLGRVRAAADVADAVHDAGLVIEAIPERLDLKQALFAELERHAPADAILATNTSSLSVSAIADHLHATLGGDTYVAPALLRRMVAEGRLGRKSGQGFYQW